MGSIAIVTDSNSGITQTQAKELGIFVLPMPFFINGETFFEDIDLTQEEFYCRLEADADISTSMPSIGSVTDLWDEVLKDYSKLIYIPMSSGLSSSCETAMMCAEDYPQKVYVVNNQRISVTQRQSVLDAMELVNQGMSAEEIKEYLEKTKYDTSIYITLNTLYYLKKGGRITPAAAALGTLLKLKPVLQIQGDKLDAFAKARTFKQAKNIMLDAIKNDFEKRFHDSTGETMWIQTAYTKDKEAAIQMTEEFKQVFPNHNIFMAPLALSIACHIGPGSLAIACTQKIDQR